MILPDTATSTIIPLEQAARHPITRVGGKAHNLGRLLQAGFAVPAGFVVPVGAPPEAILPFLNGSLWAVRSSGAGEDAGGQSFAGQHESFLHVPAGQVPGKIDACRASADTAAARAYRQGQPAQAMAVIVQAMIPAEASGVAFGADPAGGSEACFWLEMARGTGDGLVSGSVAPCELVLPRDASRWPAGFRADLPVPADSLPTLVRLLERIEQHFGEPQDVEWAYAGGEFWLLQARPITTAHRGWTRANIGEVVPGVVTPLTWSVFQAHVTGQPEGNESALRLFAGRAYLNESMLLTSFAWLAWADAQAVGRALGMEAQAPRHRHSLAERGASLLFLLDLLGLNRRLAARVRRFQQAGRPPLTPSQAAGLPELLAAWDAWTAQAFRLHLYTTTYAVGAYGFLCRWLRRRRPDRAASLEADLLQQLSASQSAGIGLALQALAETARALGLETIDEAPGDPAFRARFQAFLDEYGDRAVEEFELYTPRWREDPAPVLALLNRYLQQPNPRLGAGTQGQEAPGILGRLQHGYARFVGLREAMKHEVICGYGALRTLYLRVGQALVEAGRLSEADDVFFLSKSEVAGLQKQPQAGLDETIRLRRIRWQRHRQVRFEAAGTGRAAEGNRLKGLACSRGTIEGTARVAHAFEAGLHVRPDEILVVPQADPAWTPLFLCAAGVVSEIGGYLSHSATVAREFGIPAVFNVPGATRLLQTGQRLRIDGTQGIVEILGS
ncbi:MAG: PEP/pyruvate-binding domain-containing protein [Chloroflexota bacterium]